MTEFYNFIQQQVIGFDKLIFKKFNLWALYALSLVYIVLFYGVGIFPGDHLIYNISKNPLKNVIVDTPHLYFLYDSILLPFTVYFTGLNSSKLMFYSFNLFIILSGSVLLVYLSKKRFGSDAAKLIAILFVLSPLSVDLFAWVGHYDSMTYFLQVLLFFSTHTLLLFVIGFFGGLGHFPIMLFSGASLLIFKIINREKGLYWKSLLVYLLGITWGYFILKMYQEHYGLGITIDRLNYLQLYDFQKLTSYIFGNFLALVFSLYNVLWIAVLFIAHFLFFKNRGLFYAFLFSNLVFFILTGLVLDQTRVFALLSWPLLFWAFLYALNSIKEESENYYIRFRHFLSAVTIAGLFIPRIIVWMGSIFFSASWKPFFAAIQGH